MVKATKRASKPKAWEWEWPEDWTPSVGEDTVAQTKVAKPASQPPLAATPTKKPQISKGTTSAAKATGAKSSPAVSTKSKSTPKPEKTPSKASNSPRVVEKASKKEDVPAFVFPDDWVDPFESASDDTADKSTISAPVITETAVVEPQPSAKKARVSKPVRSLAKAKAPKPARPSSSPPEIIEPATTVGKEAFEVQPSSPAPADLLSHALEVGAEKAPSAHELETEVSELQQEIVLLNRTIKRMGNKNDDLQAAQKNLASELRSAKQALATQEEQSDRTIAQLRNENAAKERKIFDLQVRNDETERRVRELVKTQAEGKSPHTPSEDPEEHEDELPEKPLSAEHVFANFGPKKIEPTAEDIFGAPDRNRPALPKAGRETVRVRGTGRFAKEREVAVEYGARTAPTEASRPSNLGPRPRLTLAGIRPLNEDDEDYNDPLVLAAKKVAAIVRKSKTSPGQSEEADTKPQQMLNDLRAHLEDATAVLEKSS